MMKLAKNTEVRGRVLEINHRSGMKAENQRHILNLINKHPSFRAALATELGLTQAAVSLLTEELIRDEIIGPAEIGAAGPMVGRRPEILDIRADWGAIVGISIDRSQVTIGIVDLKGMPITENTLLPVKEDYEDTIRQIGSAVKKMLAQMKGQIRFVIGAGVAIPGPMDLKSGSILEPPGFPASWYHLPIAELLEKQLGFPVYAEHNSRALAQAEICLGAGDRYSHFMILNVNAGIGSGLVLNGKVYTGAHGIGCEIGHMSVERGGRICFCGRRGCLEQYASAAAVLHEVNRICPDIHTWTELIDRAYNGNQICCDFLEQAASYFGEVIRNVMSLCDLEAVFFTGQIAYRGELILKLIREKAQKNAVAQMGKLPEIALSSIPGNPYLVSSASILIYKLYNQPLFFYEKNIERKKGKE